eukprot:5785714-Alexandrium_andersonii.AAC.1
MRAGHGRSATRRPSVGSLPRRVILHTRGLPSGEPWGHCSFLKGPSAFAQREAAESRALQPSA